MPVFPSQNLNTQKICESYPRLLQIYSGSLVLNGTGSLKQFLNVTSSYANYSISSSYASNFGNSITQSFTSSNVWTFNHNLGNKYVIIQTVDTNDNQLIPDVINLFDDNTAIIGFSVPTAGTALATRGGVRIFSSSYGYYNLNTGSTYPITSSWAINALNGGTKLYTGSYYPITSSWARNAVTASYALSYSGTSGTAGSSGTSGTSGINGINGSSGTSGTTGSSGSSGTSGQTGSSGSSGSSGTSGQTGSSGSSGTAGISGLLNLTGSTISGVITYNGNGGDVQSNVKVQSGYVILNQVSSSLNFVDDVAAAAAGVPTGGLYRNGNFILIRIT